MSHTLKQQLEDPIFRAWMMKTPRRDTNPPYKNWRVLIRRKKKGSWARVEFNTYQEALAWTLKHLDDYHDMAITSKLYAFRPPVVTEKATGKKRYHFPPGLNNPSSWWCPFCRRITRFRFFKTHHNMKSYYCGQTKQCEFCAAPVKFTAMKEWKW